MFLSHQIFFSLSSKNTMDVPVHNECCLTNNWLVVVTRGQDKAQLHHKHSIIKHQTWAACRGRVTLRVHRERGNANFTIQIDTPRTAQIHSLSLAPSFHFSVVFRERNDCLFFSIEFPQSSFSSCFQLFLKIGIFATIFQSLSW